MTKAMFRLLKLALTLVVMLVVGIVGVAWIGLEGASRKAAARATAPWAKRLTWEKTSTRLLPPAAVLEGAVLVNQEGDELLRARRIVLPLLPGAWTQRGAATASPRLEGFSITLEVPRDDAPSWAEALDDGAIPAIEWWSGSDGSILVRFGGADAEALRFEDVRISRRKYSIHAEGRVAGVTSSRAVFDGAWEPSGKTAPVFTIEAGPFDASPWSAWILAPGEGRVRGGRATLAGKVRFPANTFAFDGSLATSDVLVEGADARPGAVEAALSRGNGDASFAMTVQAPMNVGVDWRTRVREAVHASATKR